jgi:polygalacturonase
MTRWTAISSDRQPGTGPGASGFTAVVVGLALTLALLSGAPARAAPLTIDAPAATPSDFGFPVPDPEPALPSGFDDYAPPRLAVSADAPHVAAFTRTAGPDDSFVISGAGFDAASGFRVFSQSGSRAAWTDAARMTPGGDAVAGHLPDTLPPWGLYLVWPWNAHGAGQPIGLNRTEAWWAGPLPAAAGGTLSVFGRNLAHDNGTSQAWVYLKPLGPHPGQWAAVTAVNPYRVDFTVPADLAAGDYEIWSHNGHGGRFGWSGPLAVTIAASAGSFDGRPSFDVHDYGAKGDGVADDGPGIQAALADAAAQAPATVHFPAGTYLTSRSLLLPNAVRWQGDGRDVTTLRLDPAAATKEAFLVADGAGSGNRVDISGLTIDATGRPADAGAAVSLHGVARVHITAARILSAPLPYFDLDGARGVVLADVDLTGSGGFLKASAQIFIEDCRFLLGDKGVAAIVSWGGHELSITGNTARDRDPSTREGTSQGRFFVSQAHNGGTRDIYIADNTTTGLAPPSPEWSDFDQNTGEQILFEQCCADLVRSVVATDAGEVTLSADLPAMEAGGAPDLLIVSGPGSGQYRRILGYDPARRTVRIDRPWDLTPPPGSLTEIVGVAARAAIYRNRLDGKALYATQDTASSGVQLFSNSADIVVDGNTITRVRGGVELWSVGVGSMPQLNSVFFNLVTNNEIYESYDGLVTYTQYLYADAPGAIGHLGNIFRGNRGDRLVHAGISMTTWPGFDAGGYDTNVFEHNRLADAPRGIIAGDASAARQTPMRDTILYRNSFSRGAAPLIGSRGMTVAPGSSWIAHGNLWSGFEQPGPDGS